MLFRSAKQFNFVTVSLVFLVLLVGIGCASQKPLPYSYTSPQPLPVTGPKLIIAELKDERSRDEMDKVLKVQESVEEVVFKEMEGAGIFREVEQRREGDGESFTLKPTIRELRWEVPDYDRKLGIAIGIGVATGGIGGFIYGSTGTDVYGYSSMQFVLLHGEKEILTKEYKAKAIEKKSKLACDTAPTYREMAAKALQQIMLEFKSDLQKVDWSGARAQVSKVE
jgi:hypothetical protein